MIVLDANILLYAYNGAAPEHDAAKAWLENSLRGEDTIALPWVTIWAFVRIATNAALWPNPLPAAKAMAVIGQWLEQPGVVLLEPGSRHLEILEVLMTKYRAVGARVTDAVLAALAIEHGAALASCDQDFRRFPKLRWIDPLGR
jgi:toxin-antitoxin system PIN domain toxin